MKFIRQILIAGTALFIIACNTKPQQSSIEGTITNLPSDITQVSLRTKDQVKNIKIENGVFKDTINIDGEFAYLQIGNQGKTLFLDKNSQLKINLDIENIDNSIIYSGKGKNTNNYILQREKITFKVFEQLDSINKLDAKSFDALVVNLNNSVKSLWENSKNINPIVLNAEKESLPVFIENLKKQYNTLHNTATTTGTKALNFTYENYKGSKTSLEDLEGNLVYIDVWATWCPPCKAEIPYLQELERKFHGKKIKFVSISIDNPNTKNKWKKMIADKQMSGIQLFADGDNSLMEAYQISGIPRFLLIDAKGNIINSNAPRPSSGSVLESLINENL